jgi:hypothetical protein
MQRITHRCLWRGTVKLVDSGIPWDKMYFPHWPSFRIIQNNTDSSGRDYRICSHWASFRLIHVPHWTSCSVTLILLAGTREFVYTEQVSALFTFRLGQALLYWSSEDKGKLYLIYALLSKAQCYQQLHEFNLSAPEHEVLAVFFLSVSYSPDLTTSIVFYLSSRL